MKTLTKLALAITILTTGVAARADWVTGHFRSNGTYVAPYYRTPANGIPFDKLELSRLSLAMRWPQQILRELISRSSSRIPAALSRLWVSSLALRFMKYYLVTSDKTKKQW